MEATHILYQRRHSVVYRLVFVWCCRRTQETFNTDMSDAERFRLRDASLLQAVFNPSLTPAIMSDLVSTRVTSTRLQDYVGQSVRLVAKTLRVCAAEDEIAFLCGLIRIFTLDPG